MTNCNYKDNILIVKILCNERFLQAIRMMVAQRTSLFHPNNNQPNLKTNHIILIMYTLTHYAKCFRTQITSENHYLSVKLYRELVDFCGENVLLCGVS